MDRRGFIGRLAAGFGALVVAPPDLLWQPMPEAVELVRPEALVGLRQITAATLAEIEHILGVSVPHNFDGAGVRIGDRAETYELNQQYSVELGPQHLPSDLDSYGIDVQRYLLPAAKALVERMRGVKAGGQLPLSPQLHARRSVVSNPQSGLSLRGSYVYEVGYPHLRFDTLVAQ